MDDENQSTNFSHTKVCAPLSAFPNSILALMIHEIETRKLTITGIAQDTGYNRRSLRRLLTGKQELRVRDILVICNSLGIDRLRAWFAIECMGDWQHYYDVTLQVALRLFKPVILKINERATDAIEPLSAGALETLSDWIANTVIRNQDQIHSRRESFADLPRI
jgi:hypothetical protein